MIERHNYCEVQVEMLKKKEDKAERSTKVQPQ